VLGLPVAARRHYRQPRTRQPNRSSQRLHSAERPPAEPAARTTRRSPPSAIERIVPVGGAAAPRLTLLHARHLGCDRGARRANARDQTGADAIGGGEHPRARQREPRTARRAASSDRSPNARSTIFEGDSKLETHGVLYWQPLRIWVSEPLTERRARPRDGGRPSSGRTSCATTSASARAGHDPSRSACSTGTAAPNAGGSCAEAEPQLAR
jgi:hypothetical protein